MFYLVINLIFFIVLEVACGEHERNLDNLISDAQKKYRENSDLYQINSATQLNTNNQGKCTKK